MTVLDTLRKLALGDGADRRFEALADAIPALVVILDEDRIVFANSNARARRADAIGSPFSAIAHPDARDALRARMTQGRALAGRATQRFELKLDGAPGFETWADLTLAPLEYRGRAATLALGFDVTDRKMAEGAMRESERRLRDLIENVQLVSVLLDATGELTFANEYALELLGHAEESLIGRNWFDVVLPLERVDEMKAAFRERVAGRMPPHEEYEIVTARGEPRFVSWTSTLLHDPAGAVTGVALIGADVTERRRAEQRLLHDALHDSLTGLPNRALFMDRLRTSLARLKRRPQHVFAVLFVDLDRFKVVNDSLGHMVGDQFLVQLGRAITGTLRAEHTVARLGGDEFAILLDDLDEKEDAIRVVDRIFQALQTPLRVGEQDIFATVSIGIAYASPDYATAEDILRDADTAMYQAKSTGRARLQVFDESMHKRAVGLLRLEHSLRRATEQDEFVLYYQPIVDLQTGALAGFEALIRWNHPQRGIVSPYEFIHLAEETGLIFRIGDWTLREACRWLASSGLPDHLTINVNLSGRQFSHGDLIADVSSILAKTGLAPHRLKLEITESVIMDNPEIAVDLLKRLKALGTRLCIDDFGTGYSSLSYLLRFPADTLKIDRSFVMALGQGGRNEDIVRAVVSLAKGLEMDIVAEGVELTRQADALRALGCHYGQGYLYSAPIDAGRALAFRPPGH